jgi:hypothetical protein
MVTLEVILAVIAFLLLVGGFRLVRKGSVAASNGGVVGVAGTARAAKLHGKPISEMQG